MSSTTQLSIKMALTKTSKSKNHVGIALQYKYRFQYHPLFSSRKCVCIFPVEFFSMFHSKRSFVEIKERRINRQYLRIKNYLKFTR